MGTLNFVSALKIYIFQTIHSKLSKVRRVLGAARIPRTIPRPHATLLFWVVKEIAGKLRDNMEVKMQEIC